MFDNFSILTKCRMCQCEALTEFLHLGEQPLANAFIKAENLHKDEPKFPLRLLFCHDCNLVQLGEVVDPGSLFSDYIYFSGGMPSTKHFHQYAKDVVDEFINSDKDLLVEIGSNDGHLLKVIKNSHLNILGVDPAKNIARQATAQGIPTIADFFSQELAVQIKQEHGPAAVIIGNNVVAHIPDHQSLFSGIKHLLAPDGVFIMEAPYLIDMFENLAFDTIYHEHYSYLTVRPLLKLVSRYGMEIFRMAVNPVQGHSLRIFICQPGTRPIEASVEQWQQRELDLGLDKLSSYQALASQIYDLKSEIVDLLNRLKSEQKTIYAYGASARGNVLLNFYGIGPDILDFATEELPSKIGLYTPGMRIPIRHVQVARQKYPDYFFFLAWNYKEPVFVKEQAYIAQGGKFIMPVGKERII